MFNEVLPNETSEFTHVNRAVTRTTRKSSLFNLVEQLISERHRLLARFTIKKISSLEDNNSERERNAFLIIFKEPLVNPIFARKNFICLESHLTIDQFYSDDTSVRGARGFTCAHSTEQYRNSVTGQEMVVHAYFNMQGQYVFSQVKMKPDQYLDIGKELENAIKNNSLPASTLLNELLNEKSNRYASAVLDASKQQAALESLSLNFDASLSKAEYLRVAKRFLDLIDLINIWNDEEVDVRKQIVEKIVVRLTLNKPIEEAEELSLENQNEFSAETSDETSEDAAKVEKKHNKKDPKMAADLRLKQQRKEEKEKNEVLYTKSLNEVLDLERQLIPLLSNPENNLRKILQAHDIAAQLNSSVINFMFLDIVPKKTKKNKVVARVQQKIASLPKLLDFLKYCALAGEHENFYLLYEKVGNELDSNFYIELLRRMVFNIGDLSLLSKQIKICNFLFEKSQAYRSAIILLGYTLTFNEDEKIGRSLLLHAASMLNYPVYSMLLEHGYNPNGAAVCAEQNILSNIKVQLCYPEREEFVKCLIKHGATLDAREMVATEEQISAARRLPSAIKAAASQSLPVLKEVLKPLPEEQHVMFNDMLKVKWDILIAAKSRNYRILPFMAEISDLAGLAMTISHFVSPYGKNFTLVELSNMQTSGVIFVKNVDILHLFVSSQVTKDPQSSQNKITYVFYPANAAFVEFDPLIAFCDIFSKKCEEDSKHLEETLKMLELEAQNVNNDLRIRFQYCRACCMLISEKGNLTASDLQRLMRFYYMMGLFLLKETDPILTSQSALYLHNVIEVAKNSSHFEFLKETPTFLYACKKLKGTAFEYHEPNEVGIASEAATNEIEKRNAPVAPVLPQFHSSCTSLQTYRDEDRSSRSIAKVNNSRSA